MDLLSLFDWGVGLLVGFGGFSWFGGWDGYWWLIVATLKPWHVALARWHVEPRNMIIIKSASHYSGSFGWSRERKKSGYRVWMFQGGVAGAGVAAGGGGGGGLGGGG